MHEYLRAFVQSAVEAFDLTGPVYEFGLCPLDVPGEPSLSECFEGTTYLGCELYEDLLTGHPDEFPHLPFPDAAARTVICMNLIERMPNAQPAMREFTRILAPGGAFLAGSSRAGLAPDFAGRLVQPRLLREVLADLEVVLVGWQGRRDDPHSVYGIGFQAPVAPSVLAGVSRFMAGIEGQTAGRPAGRWPRRWLQHAARWLALERMWNRAHNGGCEFLIDVPGHCCFGAAVPTGGPHSPTGTRLDVKE